MTHSLTTWHGQHHAGRMTGGGKAFELNHSGYPMFGLFVARCQHRGAMFSTTSRGVHTMSAWVSRSVCGAEDA